MRATAVRRICAGLKILLVLTACGCNRKPVDSGDSFAADASLDGSSIGGPRLKGHLLLSKDHLLIDWGLFAEAFDLKKRTGWRALPNVRVYQDLSSKDLSTYAPQMTNGSLCPNAQVPSDCRLVGKEEINRRMANKWDVWNPKGFHVYYWTDETLAITLRCEIGETKYEVRNLRQGITWDALFEVPAGFQRVQNVLKPQS